MTLGGNGGVGGSIACTPNGPGTNLPCMVPNQKGACAVSKTICMNGEISCPQTVTAVTEICNGIDDNCDGLVDNAPFADMTGKTCDTGKLGQCKAGTFICMNGMDVCEQINQPMVELCDGYDNDCNGKIDDGPPWGDKTDSMCDTGKQGICAAGTWTCANGMDSCKQNEKPTAEVCDGLDHNCDGTPNNGPPWMDTTGMSCNTGLPGVCATGTYSCNSMKNKDDCPQAVQPSPELCDGLDNNCDGTVDNIPDVNSTCAKQNPSAVNVQAWACTAGACQIAACTPGYINVKDNASMGCTCSGVTFATMCAGASPVPVAFPGTKAVTGIIDPAAGDAWLAVTFTGYHNSNGDAGAIHFQADLGADPEYQMSVFSDCASTQTACGGGETSTGAGTWEWRAAHDANCGAAQSMTGCTNNDAVPSTVYVRVHRTNAAPTCTPFTVTLTNN